MRRLLTIGVFLVLAVNMLYAQGMGSNTQVANTDEGLFVMRAGVVAKFDVETLQVKGEYPLFGAAPQMPADRTDQAAMRAYRTEMQRRNAPGVLLTTKESLLILIGDGFARINQKTFEIEAKGSIAAVVDPAAPAPAPNMFAGMEPAPTCLLDGNILYIIRSREVISLDITDGKVLLRTPVPADMMPQQRMNQPGGGGAPGGAGGGARGGAGGGGANNPAN